MKAWRRCCRAHCRAVPDIEHLAGLGNAAEQRVVAALAFLLAIEAYCAALGKAPGGNDRAVEVQGDPCQAQGPQSRAHQLAIDLAQLLDTARVHPGQGAAHRGDIRQARDPQQALHQWIVLVITHVLQATVAEQQVDDQQHRHHAMAEDRADGEMAEAARELLLQSQLGEQRLEYDQSGIGCQFFDLRI